MPWPNELKTERSGVFLILAGIVAFVLMALLPMCSEAQESFLDHEHSYPGVTLPWSEWISVSGEAAVNTFAVSGPGIALTSTVGCDPAGGVPCEPISPHAYLPTTTDEIVVVKNGGEVKRPLSWWVIGFLWVFLLTVATAQGWFRKEENKGWIKKYEDD